MENVNNDLEDNSTIILNNSLISSLKTCKLLKLHESPLNNISVNNDGSLYLTPGNDSSIYIYSIKQNETIRHLVNKKYGCDKAIFTHHTNAILCASKNDYRIMYWCTHNNQILFSFLGHSDLITDLSMNPFNDLFLSTSNDKTSRLWDLNKKKCLCIFQDSQCAIFDNTGKVLTSVTYALDKETERYENFINLYNIEKPETINENNRPFDVFSIKSSGFIKKIKFTNNGDYLIAITDNYLFIIDAVSGKIKHEIEINDEINTFDITPDGKYIALACASGNVLIYSDKGILIKTLEFHTKNCECLCFNPRYLIMATADTNLVFWIPDEQNKQ
jgi:COMPASS component SWD2